MNDEKLPNGWIRAGSHPKDYDMGVDHTVAHGGKASGYIKSKDIDPHGFGTLMQTFKADNHCDKRLRMSGYVKTEMIENWTGLWMRVDGPSNRALSFDNMQDRPLKGTMDWQEFEIVLDVPEDSINIAFGILLTEKGQVWVDDFQFQEVSNKTPTTGTAIQNELSLTPINLDFED